MHNKPSQTVIGSWIHHSYRHLNISLVCLSHNGLGLRILFCNIYVLIYEACLQNRYEIQEVVYSIYSDIN